MAKVIAELRAELEEAINQSAEKSLRFEPGQITVELSVEVQAKGKAGVRFYVVEIGGEAGTSHAHKIKIPLTPVSVDGKKILTSGTSVPS